MGLVNEYAQYRAWKRGVLHTTLNPEGPGAVRIHLVPPRYQPFGRAPYVVILNGYYILPLGYSWAVLLGYFLEEVNRREGRPMGGAEMERVVDAAVSKARRTYYDTPRDRLAGDLGAMLASFTEVARGRTPEGGVGTMSLREYAPHMGAPHRMDLMVSAMTGPDGGWNCNLKCRHCYAAGQERAGAKELSTAQWSAVIDRCRRAGIPQLTFTGGEPTLRGDLAELVAHASWFVTRLNTNGVLLTPELCAKLRGAGLDSVQVTLYSGGPEIHDPLVGAGRPGVAGNWERSVAGMRNALAAGLDLSVNTPLCRDNAAYERTLAFLHGEGVRFVSCSGLIETGRAVGGGSRSAQLSPEEMDPILRRAAAYCAENGMELTFTSPGRARVETLRELGLSVPMCGACLSNMAVAPDGAVVPCQSWLGGKLSLGNLLRDDWRAIWEHPDCKAIRAMGEPEALLCPLRAKEGGDGP